MSEWKAKRFWDKAEAAACEGGWEVRLDGRSIQTPGKRPLLLPGAALARAVAGEWQAQEGEIDPRTMPFTRAANSAHDKVAPQRAEVADMLAAYGRTDLLCYRAPSPEPLQKRQAEGWDPLLDWAAARFGARLALAEGVMPAAQPEAAIAALRADLDRADDFTLTALHDLITISGSLILALAVLHGQLSGAQAWALSRIDEDWQAEQWGEDAEAGTHAAAKMADFLQAERLLSLLGAEKTAI